MSSNYTDMPLFGDHLLSLDRSSFLIQMKRCQATSEMIFQVLVVQLRFKNFACIADVHTEALGQFYNPIRNKPTDVEGQQLTEPAVAYHPWTEQLFRHYLVNNGDTLIYKQGSAVPRLGWTCSRSLLDAGL